MKELTDQYLKTINIDNIQNQFQYENLINIMKSRAYQFQNFVGFLNWNYVYTFTTLTKPKVIEYGCIYKITKNEIYYETIRYILPLFCILNKAKQLSTQSNIFCLCYTDDERLSSKSCRYRIEHIEQLLNDEDIKIQKITNKIVDINIEELKKLWKESSINGYK